MTIDFNIPIFEEIRDVLWESISEALGIEFRFDDQSSARNPATGVPEDKNYGTLKIISGPTQEGTDDERFLEDGVAGVDLKVETVGQRELTLSINIYRSGANSLMSKLQKIFNSRNFRHRLYQLAKTKYSKELIVIEALSSQDLTSLVQSDYEERSQMDVRLRTTSSIIESIDPVDEVTIDGKIENVAEEIVDESTTTIKIP